MRRTVALLAAFSALLIGCGRGQNPSLGGSKAAGPPETDLTVVAKNIAFNPTTLTAPAGKPLTITFRNEDSVNHSFHLFGGTAGDIKTDVKPGPSTDTLHAELRVAATYNYQCDVHPTQMKGTLVVVKPATS
jgi:plastocyanin